MREHINSPKVKEAVKKSFDFLDSLSNEDFNKLFKEQGNEDLGELIANSFECSDCTVLKAQVNKYREALAFYADKETYKFNLNMYYFGTFIPIKSDKGEKARKALEPDNSKEV